MKVMSPSPPCLRVSVVQFLGNVLAPVTYSRGLA